jgi:hypothetical protein
VPITEQMKGDFLVEFYGKTRILRAFHSSIRQDSRPPFDRVSYSWKTIPWCERRPQCRPQPQRSIK